MRRNLTLSLEDSLIKKTRVLAAGQHKSISRYIADTLESLIEQREAYEIAKGRALKKLEKGYNLGWKKPSTRAELYER